MTDQWLRRLAVFACVAVVMGASLLLIRLAGSMTPVDDQWDAIASGTLVPYQDGTLTAWHILTFHNEHRLAFPRLISLSLFLAIGAWNPLLEMAVNALIHALGCGLVLAMLCRPLDRFGVAALAVFAAIMFGVPFAAFNVLGSFQSQFYLLVLFGVSCVALASGSTAFSVRWWLATVLGVASFLSGASGALTLASTAALASAQAMVGARRGTAEWVGIAVHGALAAAMIADVPNLAHHVELRAHSLGQFLAAFGLVAGWPAASAGWPAILKWLAALLLYAPVLLIAWRLLVQRPGLGDSRWCYVALAGWIGLQLASLAYGRAIYPVASRYLDIVVIGVVLNAACLLSLLQSLPVRVDKRPELAGAAVWLVLALIGSGHRIANDVANEIGAMSVMAVHRTANLKAYLRTGDVAYINKDRGGLPYPNAEVLRRHLERPQMRAVLPPELFDRSPPNERVVRRVTRVVLRDLNALLPVGIAMLFIVAWGVRPCAPP